MSPGLAGRPCQSQPTPVDACPGPLSRQIRQEVASGGFTVAGRQRVGGVKAIKLIGKRHVTGWGRLGTPGHPPMIHKGIMRQMIWVDPASYLPVRWTTTVTQRHAPLEWAQEDLRWLPPAKASLAHLRLAIPPGFRHV